MLAATLPWRPTGVGNAARPGLAELPAARGTVGLLVGCVQEGLYSRVNTATARTLEANGFRVVPVVGQDCCGALHAHGGDLDRARSLARANIDAFLASDAEQVAVNTAGCGAAMKDYGSLLENDEEYRERARHFAGRVKDVTELLAAVGPREGARLEAVVAYDHPCHLLHAQRIERAPLDVLAAIPGLEVRIVTNAAECCGGAGIYGLTHPDLGGRIGADKVAAVRAAKADAVSTPNPGCMMQIGAGLRLQGAREGVVHPVELLDESYRSAGFYAGSGG
jgi:glycolate oxidase iron-sulfur subunit